MNFTEILLEVVDWFQLVRDRVRWEGLDHLNSYHLPQKIASFEAFTAVIFQAEVFWVVTPCSVIVGYHRFGGSYCLHLQGEEDLEMIFPQEIFCPWNNLMRKYKIFI
jgi:hypothetical protein